GQPDGRVDRVSDARPRRTRAPARAARARPRGSDLRQHSTVDPDPLRPGDRRPARARRDAGAVGDPRRGGRLGAGGLPRSRAARSSARGRLVRAGAAESWVSIRAFAPAGVEPSPGATIELDEQESHYLVKVRRARVGEALELFDGRGRAWTAIVRASGRRARVEVEAALPVAEPVPRVLLLGLPDQPATLEALTGASELGATHVVLVACERSQGRVPSVERIERV